MSKFDILMIFVYLGTFVGCIFLGKWFFELIMSSDMPDWLKYMFLK